MYNIFIATKQFVLNILNFCFVAIKYYINKIRLRRDIVYKAAPYRCAYDGCAINGLHPSNLRLTDV